MNLQVGQGRLEVSQGVREQLAEDLGICKIKWDNVGT